MPDDKLDHIPAEEELESLKARIDELEGSVVEKVEELKAKDTRLSEARTRIAELEQIIADRDNELAALKQALAESEEVLTGARNSLAQAVASYRTLVVQANPDILDELITGDSIEAIDHLYNFAASFGDVEGLAVEYASDLGEANMLVQRLHSEYPQVPIYISRASPVIGTHTGPSLILVSVFGSRQAGAPQRKSG